jgi:hypothetical protein
MWRQCLIIPLLAWLAPLQAASLTFKETLKEIHAPADVQSVTAEFAFTNRTNKTVDVVKYDAACSCMNVQISNGKLRYAPGESGVIKATFDMGNFSGTVDKVIAVWLDKDPQDKPSVALTVRVHIPVLVAINPKTLSWNIGEKATPQTIRVTMNHSKPIHLKSVTSSSPAFTHEMRALEEGKSYEVVVTPTEMGTPGLAVLRLDTDCEIAKHKIQQAFAVVRKPVPGAAGKP